MLETPEKVRELQRKLYQKPNRRKDTDCESRWKKMIGKPYSGELNVRFDEGELEIEHQPLRQLSTLTRAFLALCAMRF